MKKITVCFSILAASVALIIAGCNKVTPKAPDADTELQSSIDATYALFTVTDCEVISSFITDNSTANPTFYAPITNTITIDADTLSDITSAAFNNNLCADGRLRNGTVRCHRDTADPITHHHYSPYTTANSRYYHTKGFSERFTLEEYVVDGWSVITANNFNNHVGDYVEVMALMDKDNFDPKVTKLSWSVRGSFRLKKGLDSMFIHLELTKTLENSGDTAVFNKAKNSPIVWKKAKVSYVGTCDGVTLNGAKFNMLIKSDQAIIRDFTCAPDKVQNAVPTGTNASVATITNNEYHPFVDGVTSFTTAALYPRQIYFGGSQSFSSPACDNSGAVMIKGVSYPIDFRKN